MSAHPAENDGAIELPVCGTWQRFDSAASLGHVLSAVALSEDERDGDLSVSELRTIARTIGSRLGPLVAEPHRIETVLYLLGDEFFVPEQGWRELFQALEGATCDDVTKVMVLARYRRYLLRKIEALEALEGDGTCIDEISSFSMPTAGRAPAGPDSTQVRLVKSATTEVHVTPGARVPIWLGRRRFYIEVGATTSLVDDAGGRTILRQGRNLVGRARYADAVIDSTFADVSRSHLMVEVFDGRPVSLRDLSSRGTWVPRYILSVGVAA